MSDTKPTLLLATALFLISAPQPDSRTIAELTHNFIVPVDERALQASEAGPSPSQQLAVRRPSRPEPESDVVGDSPVKDSVGETPQASGSEEG